MRKLLACFVFALAFGCGIPDGPPRYDLSGTVTHGGKPVPAGTILFTPDANNPGPGTSADIKDGKYQTRPGMGVIGGLHKISISGFDGVPVNDGKLVNPNGKSLFPDYQTTVDLPRAAGTQDFDVPKQK